MSITQVIPTITSVLAILISISTYFHTRRYEKQKGVIDLISNYIELWHLYINCVEVRPKNKEKRSEYVIYLKNIESAILYLRQYIGIKILKFKNIKLMEELEKNTRELLQILLGGELYSSKNDKLEANEEGDFVMLSIKSYPITDSDIEDKIRNLLKLIRRYIKENNSVDIDLYDPFS